jgi:hypothetical protein
MNKENTNENNKDKTRCQIRLCNGNKANQICQRCKRSACGKCVFATPTVCQNCVNNQNN